MPVTVAYPGVYLEEVPSGVRTITGVATSIGAFVDYFPAGPMNKAVRILNLASFNKQFGSSAPSGLDAKSEASYGIQQFFLNGGTEAYVVRVGSLKEGNAPTAASVGVGDGTGVVAFVASAQSAGTWGNGVRLEIDYATTDPSKLFNLTVTEYVTVNGNTSVASSEVFRNLQIDPTQANDLTAVVNAGSQLITISGAVKGKLPAATGTTSTKLAALSSLGLAKGDALNVSLGTAAMGTLPGLPEPLPTTYAALAGILQAQIRALNPKLGSAIVSVIGSPASGVYLLAEPGTTSPADYLTFADAAGSLATKLGLAAPPPAAPPAPGAPPAPPAPAPSANVQQYVLGGGGTQQQVATGKGKDGSGNPTVVPAPGTDGTWDPVNDADGIAQGIIGDPVKKTGLYALYDVDLFNILCLPVTTTLSDTSAAAVSAAAEKLCLDRRAFYILDVPQNKDGNRDTLDGVMDWLGSNGSLRSRNAAVYFPRIDIPDPLNGYRLRATPPSGTIAGVYATTDANRGVWKAPAGTEAILAGVQKLQYLLTDGENGVLNPLAVNCLRQFPVFGPVSWGARTLYGADQMADDYKYIPVRRLALYIEESLYRGTQWVVFEPNGAPLWSQIRLNVGAFMQELFRQGAFKGKTPMDAYFVKCDDETTPPDQINLGIVNVVVGFAPLKPAEFVVIQLQQKAADIAS